MRMLNLVFFDPVNLNFQQFYDIFCSECWSIVSVELVRLTLCHNLTSIFSGFMISDGISVLCPNRAPTMPKACPKQLKVINSTVPQPCPNLALTLPQACFAIFLFWMLEYCFNRACKVSTWLKFNLDLLDMFFYDLILTINLIFNLIETLVSKVTAMR